jgi:aminoglycoside 2'-N-acetyltransferase I
MRTRRLLTAQSEDLEPDQLAEVNALCETAFEEPFAGFIERVGPGLHVVTQVDGQVVAHAMVIDRPLYLGHEADVAIDAGYVEAVATRPDMQGQGHGAATMRRVGEILAEEYAVGALATGSNGFYERLGWETWTGPTSVRMPDGERVRSPSEDGHIMILRTPRTPSDLRVDAPICVDWRPEEPW